MDKYFWLNIFAVRDAIDEFLWCAEWDSHSVNWTWDRLMRMSFVAWEKKEI
jgi:hypothetical protein